MTFVTLGTQSFPFNRLLELVDRLVEEGVLRGEVFAQVGYSTYVPRNYSYVDFLEPAAYSRYIAQADLVIAHAGVGTIMSCLSSRRKLIVVPRSKRYSEHVDDHQFEIAEEFAEKGYLFAAESYDGLKAAVLAIPTAPIREYEKGVNTIESKIDEFLQDRHHRVLMVGSDLSVKGGIVSVIRNYLSYDGWKASDISFVPTHVEGSPWKKVSFFLKSLGKISRLLNTGAFDVVHIHVSERGSFTRKSIVLRMAKRKHCKVILHHHGAEFLDFYEQASAAKKARISRIMGEADLNLVLSRRLVPIYREISPHAQVACLYNVVRTPRENQYATDAREFTMLGRLAERKGTFSLLDTIKSIDSTLAPDVIFNLCGDGDIELVRERIRALRIEHRIGHLGWAEGNTKREILSRTMAHVLFSYNEGLPMSILETMGCGIVNIATRVAAIPEVITDGETGFLVEPGDKDSLGRVLLAVSEDASLRGRISGNSFAYIAKELSLEAGISRLEQIYRSLWDKPNHE
ncbi:MAG: glycosyltransferase [Oscillospiraceae bacterium]|nr:glycosyltransferase [Oscillospiraceae bacterium]